MDPLDDLVQGKHLPCCIVTLVMVFAFSKEKGLVHKLLLPLGQTICVFICLTTFSVMSLLSQKLCQGSPNGERKPSLKDAFSIPFLSWLSDRALTTDSEFHSKAGAVRYTGGQVGGLSQRMGSLSSIHLP